MIAAPDPARFHALWRRTVGHERADEAWRALDRAYADPARAYHGWSHIEAMLRDFDDARGDPALSAVAFDNVELAIFFHDAVYDPRASDNEARSAALLQDLAGGTPAIGPEAVARVAGLIEATATHAPSTDLATQLLLDLDMAILGAAPERYEGYAAAVRREYAHVPDALWRAGRSAVLGRFLARDRLYQTERFRVRLESQARADLSGERDRLTAGSGLERLRSKHLRT